MVNDSIITGIVTFNPNLDILKKSIQSIITQECPVVIVDNGSDNRKEILGLVKKIRSNISITTILNAENKGIANALNQIMACGMKKGVEWVLTLDQDSICPQDYIESMRAFFKVEHNIAVVAPLIVDRNVGVVGHNPKGEYSVVRTCITSGAFTKTSCWNYVGKYDSRMFIDSVDFEFCYRIRKAGFKVIQTSKVKLEHSLGDGRIVSFCGIKFRDNEHSAFRCYYIAQNNIYYPLKHHLWLHLIRGNIRNLRHIIIILLYEKNKKNKLKAIIKGWLKGWTL